MAAVALRVRELAVAISAALDTVAANAAKAREQLDGLVAAARDALTSGSSELADASSTASMAAGALGRAASELHEEISTAETRKVVALESEAVRVDTALAMAADVLEGRGDLAALQEFLRSLPTSPVEHPGIELIQAGDTTSSLLPCRVRSLSTPDYGALYAVTRDGKLLLYRDQLRDGTGDVSCPIGAYGQCCILPLGPRHSRDILANLRSDWRLWLGRGSFRSVFSGGDDIIYAITMDGNLVFYREHSRSGTGDVSAPSGVLCALFAIARLLIVPRLGLPYQSSAKAAGTRF